MSTSSPDGASRIASVGYLVLASLAGGEKHGYALTKDVEEFAGVRIPPGSLYESLARLEAQGLITAVPTSDRRRPYRLTGAGAAALNDHLAAQERVVRESRRRLRTLWRLT